MEMLKMMEADRITDDGQSFEIESDSKSKYDSISISSEENELKPTDADIIC